MYIKTLILPDRVVRKTNLYTGNSRNMTVARASNRNLNGSNLQLLSEYSN